MEFLLALVLVVLVAVGMGMGFVLRGEPLRSSCSGMACLPDQPRCAGCPRRKASTQ